MKEQLEALAGPLGACYLNGKPARLDFPKGRLPRVTAQDGTDTAVFNFSVVQQVVIRQGGRFRTRDLRSFPRL